MFHSNFIGTASLLIVGASIYGFILLWIKRLKSAYPRLGISEGINKTVRIVFIILLLGLLFYLDFLRDYVFKNLTWRMDFQYQMEQGGSPEKYFDGTDSWMKAILGNTSSGTIYILKYIASAVFIMIYFLLTQFILRLAYPAYNTFPYPLLLYVLGTLSMGLIFSFYFFQWSIEIKTKFYLIAMEIGHFLESSLPALLSILGFKIYLSSQENKSNE